MAGSTQSSCNGEPDTAPSISSTPVESLIDAFEMASLRFPFFAESARRDRLMGCDFSRVCESPEVVSVSGKKRLGRAQGVIDGDGQESCCAKVPRKRSATGEDLHGPGCGRRWRMTCS